MVTTIKRASAAKASRPRSRQFWPLAALVVLLAALAIVWWPRGHKYPRATSRQSYIIMDALHTACNTKNAASLQKIESSIAREKAEGKVGEREAETFARIIAAARAGRWSEADREAINFSKDQVGRGQLFEE
jgi:hypothetical protein